MSAVDPLEMLTRAFENMGAEPDRARTMATQLMKRAQQLAERNGMSEADAMAGLLEKVIAGRRGEYGAAGPEQ